MGLHQRRRATRSVVTAGAALAMFASATPAHAATITTTKYKVTGFDVGVTNCNLAAVGSHCTAYFLDGVYNTMGGAPTTGITAIASDATVQPGGLLDGSDVAHAAASNLVTMKMSNKGKTWVVDVTVTLVCNSDPCSTSGVARFKLTLQKDSLSTYDYDAEGSTLRQGACSYSEIESVTNLLNFKGSGTVKLGTSTKAVRVYRKGNNGIEGTVDVLKQTANCPEPAVAK